MKACKSYSKGGTVKLRMGKHKDPKGGLTLPDGESTDSEKLQGVADGVYRARRAAGFKQGGKVPKAVKR